MGVDLEIEACCGIHFCAWGPRKAGHLPVGPKEDGRPMTVRTFEHSRLEPIPFPLQMSGYATPAPTLRSAITRHREKIPCALGCLRGLCWAVAIECTAAFCAYEAWHLWRFLR
jgi:hypothetical protein